MFNSEKKEICAKMSARAILITVIVIIIILIAIALFSGKPEKRRHHGLNPGSMGYVDANGNPKLLQIGSASDVLTVNSLGFPSWQSPPGSNTFSSFFAFYPNGLDLSGYTSLNNIMIEGLSALSLTLPTSSASSLSLLLYESNIVTPVVFPNNNYTLLYFQDLSTLNGSSFSTALSSSDTLIGIYLASTEFDADFAISSLSFNAPPFEITEVYCGLYVDSISAFTSIGNISFVSENTNSSTEYVYIRYCQNLTSIGTITTDVSDSGYYINIMNNNSLASVGNLNLYATNNLASVTINNNPALTTIGTITINPSLTGTVFNFDDNDLTAAALSQILENFDSSGAIDCFANLAGNQVGNHSSLNTFGRTAYTNLVGKGWTFSGF